MDLPANAHVAIIDGRRVLIMRNSGTTIAPMLEREGQSEVDDSEANAVGAAEWLNRAVLSRRIDQLLVVADPETLNEMRPHYHRRTEEALVGELDRELIGMPSPVILKVIQSS